MFKIPGRIPITIQPLFWILIFFLGWLNSGTVIGTVIWAAVIFFSVLIHEYGHALTALVFGQEAAIYLLGFGGLTERQGKSLSAWKEFIIVLNGPLAGFLLYFIFLALRYSVSNQTSPIALYTIEVGIFINLLWTILNLLPILPLDGGKITIIIFEAFFGHKGFRFACFLSLVLSAALGILLVLLGNMLGAAIFFIFTFESYKNWQAAKNMTTYDHDASLQSLLQNTETLMEKGNSLEAKKNLEYLRKETQKGAIYNVSTQYLARILSEEGSYKEAYELLLENAKYLDPDYLSLLQQLAYRLGEWERGIQYGEKAYQNNPNEKIAFLNACCYANLGKAKPTVGWLQCAIRDGFQNIKGALVAHDFDLIRQDPQFKKLIDTEELN